MLSCLLWLFATGWNKTFPVGQGSKFLCHLSIEEPYEFSTLGLDCMGPGSKLPRIGKAVTQHPKVSCSKKRLSEEIKRRLHRGGDCDRPTFKFSFQQRSLEEAVPEQSKTVFTVAVNSQDQRISSLLEEFWCHG